MVPIWQALLLTAVIIVIPCYVCYWIGRVRSDGEAFHWKRKYEEAKAQGVLLEQRLYPPIFWDPPRTDPPNGGESLGDMLGDLQRPERPL